MLTSNFDSRIADKFVVRFPKFVHQGLLEMAAAEDRSFNSEIKQAIDNWLNEESLIRKIHSTLVSIHSDTSRALALIDLAAKPPEQDESTKKYVARFSPGVRQEIGEKAKERNVSMNSLIIHATTWWVNTHREIRALAVGPRPRMEQY
jgi:predicted HicB family RNase H-like nuclease